MTILEKVRINSKMYIQRNKLESEIKAIKRDSARFCVAVFDFDWNKLSECFDTAEAAKIYELPREFVVRSMFSGGRKIISGLRFRRMARR